MQHITISRTVTLSLPYIPMICSTQQKNCCFSFSKIFCCKQASVRISDDTHKKFCNSEQREKPKPVQETNRRSMQNWTMFKYFYHTWFWAQIDTKPLEIDAMIGRTGCHWKGRIRPSWMLFLIQRSEKKNRWSGSSLAWHNAKMTTWDQDCAASTMAWCCKLSRKRHFSCAAFSRTTDLFTGFFVALKSHTFSLLVWRKQDLYWPQRPRALLPWCRAVSSPDCRRSFPRCRVSVHAPTRHRCTPRRQRSNISSTESYRNITFLSLGTQFLQPDLQSRIDFDWTKWHATITQIFHCPSTFSAQLIVNFTP